MATSTPRIIQIGGKFDLFRCKVALRKTAFGRDRYPTATFQVIADGVVAATASDMHTPEPVSLIANVQGVHFLNGMEPMQQEWDFSIPGQTSQRGMLPSMFAR